MTRTRAQREALLDEMIDVYVATKEEVHVADDSKKSILVLFVISVLSFLLVSFLYGKYICGVDPFDMDVPDTLDLFLSPQLPIWAAMIVCFVLRAQRLL